MKIFVIIYLFFIAIIGRLTFIYPDKKYLDILNVNNFYIIFLVSTTLCVIFIYVFLKMNKTKKMITTFITTFVILLLVNVFYYINLPKFTYEEAALKVMNYELQSDKQVELQIPIHREDKIGLGEASFLKTTNHTYYIYLKVENDNVVYRFNPVDGSFEKHIGDRELEEYE